MLANNVPRQKPAVYAAASDFCRIFAQDMKGLYLLSLLLTGTGEKAENCFALALDDSMKSNRIFKEWAQSWSRRMIVQNAVRMMAPAPDRIREKAMLRAVHAGVETKPEISVALNAVLSLGTFERFVFVMSILERYSDQDCTVLLDCSRRDLALARMRAAEHIACFASPSLPDAPRATRTLAQAHLLFASA